ncbi:zinc finger and SCAN domain-containing protein 21-like [Nylanderia fulva]|uniref:zinc finger and SCAN domain-containing protein 21-like n=1 Tax=Nylanderia fulva TaxID=613905 RepID=UPI0010FB1DBB|nr:zinc finger and SCAN domain-containing protein 21-like [Nylanderia fulva]
MSCDTRGQCHFCSKKHIVPEFGSDETTRALLQKSNLKLDVLNTVCSSCITKLEDLQKQQHLPDLRFEKIPTKDPVRKDSRKMDENVGGTRRSRQLTCDFCQKAFHHTGDLNKHRRKHTGEQPYTCPKCQQKFSSASNLIRHQRTHSGIKPFSCQICGRAFARKDKLSLHLQRCIVKF